MPPKKQPQQTLRAPLKNLGGKQAAKRNNNNNNTNNNPATGSTNVGGNMYRKMKGQGEEVSTFPDVTMEFAALLGGDTTSQWLRPAYVSLIAFMLTVFGALILGFTWPSIIFGFDSGIQDVDYLIQAVVVLGSMAIVRLCLVELTGATMSLPLTILVWWEEMCFDPKYGPALESWQGQTRRDLEISSRFGRRNIRVDIGLHFVPLLGHRNPTKQGF